MNSRPTRTFLSCAVLALLALSACGGEPAATEPAATPASAPEPPKITQFYASPGEVQPGGETTICYGVENTESVALEPEIRMIKPGLNRCFAHTPAETATVKLVAKGPGGEATAELTLKVRAGEPPPAMDAAIITGFVASQNNVPAGTPVTICYTLEGADSVKIVPEVHTVDTDGGCFAVKITETTTFQLTARSGGRSESAALAVKVQ